jgi:hypothetical protein
VQSFADVLYLTARDKQALLQKTGRKSAKK